jgi:ribonuclease HI
MHEETVKIFCDGGARGNPGPAAAAFVVYERGELVHQESAFLGVSTNNVAEYQAVINSFHWLNKNKSKLSDKKVFYFLDSQLVVNQLIGTFKIKSANLKPLVLAVKNLERQSGLLVNYQFVPRAKNKLADALLNETLDHVTVT